MDKQTEDIPRDLSDWHLLVNFFEEPDIARLQTPHQIRFDVRNADHNGLKDALIKKGKHLYINKPRYIRWFLQHKYHAGAA